MQKKINLCCIKPGVKLVIERRSNNIVRPESIGNVRGSQRKVRLEREVLPCDELDVAREADLVAVISEAAPATKYQPALTFTATNMVGRTDFVEPNGWIL